MPALSSGHRNVKDDSGRLVRLRPNFSVFGHAFEENLGFATFYIRFSTT
jgi:hypothetical protein